MKKFILALALFSQLALGAGKIRDADIASDANIADTKLGTIATANKVANAATTAQSANGSSKIVLRDGSGNFAANLITADLIGNASTASGIDVAPSDCSSGLVVNGINADFSLKCTAGGGGGGSWGSITGTLSDQTDLATALAGKQASLGYTAEDVANKSTSTSLGTSNTLYPTQNAVKTYVDGHTGASAWGTITGTLSDQTDLATALSGKQASLGFTAENVANKDTDGTLAANSDTKYASQKAVKTYVDGHTGASSWGSITGTLSSQTDLNTALGLKAPLAGPTFSGTVTIGSASGLAKLSSGVVGTAIAGTDYIGPTTGSAIQKASSGGLTAATAGTDYVAATTGSAVQKASSGNLTAATAGTDYSAGTSGLATGMLKSTTSTGALSIGTKGTDYVEPGTSTTYTANQSIGAKAATSTFTNDTSTGTTVNKLAKLSAGKAIITATTDAVGITGIVVSGAGTSSTTEIAINGQTSCIFDGATTAGDFVVNSLTVAGDCHDAGASLPAVQQIVGQVLSTNGSAGTYAVQVFPGQQVSSIQAGGMFLGSVVISGCSGPFSTTGTSFAALSTQTSCTYTTAGTAQAPSTIVAGIKFPSIPAGDLSLEYEGAVDCQTANKQCNFQFSDGTNVSRENSSFYQLNSQTFWSGFKQSISYSSAQGPTTLQVFAKVASGGTASVDANSNTGVIKVYWFPNAATQNTNFFANGDFGPVSYTPAVSGGIGTASGIVFSEERKGDKLTVRGTFTSGTVGASLVTVTLPSGLSINTSSPAMNINASTSGPCQIVGKIFEPVSANVVNTIVACTTTSTTQVYVGGITNAVNFATPHNGNGIFTTGAVEQIEFTVPITTWSVSPVGIAVGSNVNTGYIGQERIVRVNFGGANQLTACSSDPCAILSQSGSDVTAVNWNSTGIYTIHFATGVFSAYPTCTCVGGPAAATRCEKETTATTTTYQIGTRNAGGTATNDAEDIVCIGPH